MKHNMTLKFDTLKDIFECKDNLTEGDIVIYGNEEGVIFLQVTEIEKDTKPVKFGEWWHIHYAMIGTIPVARSVLILRTEQMTGKETFTVGGERRWFIPIDLMKTNKQEKKEVKPTLKLVKGNKNE